MVKWHTSSRRVSLLLVLSRIIFLFGDCMKPKWPIKYMTYLEDCDAALFNCISSYCKNPRSLTRWYFELGLLLLNTLFHNIWGEFCKRMQHLSLCLSSPITCSRLVLLFVNLLGGRAKFSLQFVWKTSARYHEISKLIIIWIIHIPEWDEALALMPLWINHRISSQKHTKKNKQITERE